MNRDAICSRLPHAGRMCLLDRLEHWDDDSIICVATSHRDPDNPLRHDNRLHAVCAVEYAAQAMALHASLLGAPDRPAEIGYLASVRDLQLDIEDLGSIMDELRIVAQRLSGDAGGIIYAFEIRAGARRLLAGRIAARLVEARA